MVALVVAPPAHTPSLLKSASWYMIYLLTCMPHSAGPLKWQSPDTRRKIVHYHLSAIHIHNAMKMSVPWLPWHLHPPLRNDLSANPVPKVCAPPTALPIRCIACTPGPSMEHQSATSRDILWNRLTQVLASKYNRRSLKCMVGAKCLLE